jgi:hypothetical protein
MSETRGSAFFAFLFGLAARFCVVENDRVDDVVVLERTVVAVVSELNTSDRKDERRGVKRRVVVVC